MVRAVHLGMAHTLYSLATRYVDRTANPLPAARRESLTMALALGASDAALETICDALRVARRNTIVLPRQHLETLSRGRGWARKGRGSTAVWGERVDGGYRVGPGRWTVGGNDGFSRKAETVWDVEHVTVGSETWTVAS